MINFSSVIPYNLNAIIQNQNVDNFGMNLSQVILQQEQNRISHQAEIARLQSEIASYGCCVVPNDMSVLMARQTDCCIEKDIPKKTNCPNCGASLEGKHQCRYCGTYNE